MKATNIKWDTDGDKELFQTLPTEIELPDGMYDLDDISDYLSDYTGFCHEGFSMEYTKKDAKVYLEGHLKDYELEGVEISEEDIDEVYEQANTGQDLAEAGDKCLSVIRKVLDEGLEDFDEEKY